MTNITGTDPIVYIVKENSISDRFPFGTLDNSGTETM